MPVYEYRCLNCQRRLSLYFSTFSGSLSPLCPYCNNQTLQRLFSTFAVCKTDKDIYEDILSDSQLVRGMMRNDPKTLAEWERRMSQGEKPAPEYEEMVERMEGGEQPKISTVTGEEKKASGEVKE